VNDIKAKTSALAQAALKLGEAVYGGQPGGGEAGAQKTGDDNVVDADFEEVKDDKKKSA
jgi:molecular chaperone DnaK